MIRVDLDFLFFYLFNMGFCSDGILVGSGGMLGMVEAWLWWLGSGGVVQEVKRACELVRPIDTSGDKLLMKN